MNNPELYSRANDVQRYDAERLISVYGQKIKWLHDGTDSLIDMGCGSGDVLIDFVYPCIPRNFQRIVFSDINPEMIDYARCQYGHIGRAEFRILDMATKTQKLPIDLRGQFDHVTSFYTLMWVQNQRFIELYLLNFLNLQ